MLRLSLICVTIQVRTPQLTLMVTLTAGVVLVILWLMQMVILSGQ